ncbi:hypothetical protein BS47DRAFT_1022328 [Hydnum rufescens UP504]|uniref:Uncharacterized protein n=1 Tax=Hydnum rufescens UP504 TaxID=1448309 RepID=A0A9P6AW40_9AGAM|nr:hypothetical protein BS47DRAFT_1022328 [Hydnum rufescens UP504]
MVDSLRAAEVSPAAQPDGTKSTSSALDGTATGPEIFPPTDTAALEENVQTSNPTASRRAESPPPTSTVTIVTVPPVPPTLPSATIPQDDSDTDIFAGAGDYEGLDLDDEDEGAGDPPVGGTLSGEDVRLGLVRPRWFGEDGDEALPNVNSIPAIAMPRSKSPSPGPSRPQAAKQADDAEDRDSSSQTVRLQPLATSALPSIKDLLEIDKAAEVHEKKKARREKNKAKSGGGNGEPVEPKKAKLGSEAKLNRDYQQYTSYVEKKAKGS